MTILICTNGYIMYKPKYPNRKYYKFQYGNRLYTRAEARALGRTSLNERGNILYVTNFRGWHAFMHEVECKYGQRYVENDKELKRRDKFLVEFKN